MKPTLGLNIKQAARSNQTLDGAAYHRRRKHSATPVQPFQAALQGGVPQPARRVRVGVRYVRVPGCVDTLGRRRTGHDDIGGPGPLISGPNAGSCPAGGIPPFAQQATTGTLNNSAGSYSEFDLRIARKDGEQELTRFSTIMPPGLTGNLSGIPFCPDSAIEAAKHKTGAQEKNEPSCPAAGDIGRARGDGCGRCPRVGAGKALPRRPLQRRTSFNRLDHKRHGRPVGPRPRGVIRFALSASNPTTAQVEIDSAGSDPIPHIIDGIVVNVREIHRLRGPFKSSSSTPPTATPCRFKTQSNGAGANLTTPRR